MQWLDQQRCGWVQQWHVSHDTCVLLDVFGEELERRAKSACQGFPASKTQKI
jgi:hypothetical protein